MKRKDKGIVVNIKYSTYYRMYHDESFDHEVKMQQILWKMLADEMPTDRGARVLDIGCGFGFALSALRKNGYINTKGLEVSFDQYKVAKEKGLDIILVDNTIEWLKEKKEHFDVILLLDVLEHLPVDLQPALCKEIRNRLKAGGKLIITTPNASSPIAMRYRYIDYTHFSAFTEKSLSHLLMEAYFDEIRFIFTPPTRPSLRFWRRGWAKNFRPQLVRWLWQQVLFAELPHEDVSKIPTGPNLFVVAQ